MAAWNRRPKLSVEDKAKEARIDAMRKELIELVLKNDLGAKGFDARAVFAEQTEKEVAKRRKACEKNSRGWTWTC